MSILLCFRDVLCELGPPAARSYKYPHSKCVEQLFCPVLCIAGYASCWIISILLSVLYWAHFLLDSEHMYGSILLYLCYAMRDMLAAGSYE